MIPVSRQIDGVRYEYSVLHFNDLHNSTLTFDTLVRTVGGVQQSKPTFV